MLRSQALRLDFFRVFVFLHGEHRRVKSNK